MIEAPTFLNIYIMANYSFYKRYQAAKLGIPVEEYIRRQYRKSMQILPKCEVDFEQMYVELDAMVNAARRFENYYKNIFPVLHTCTDRQLQLIDRRSMMEMYKECRDFLTAMPRVQENIQTKIINKQIAI